MIGGRRVLWKLLTGVARRQHSSKLKTSDKESIKIKKKKKKHMKMMNYNNNNNIDDDPTNQKEECKTFTFNDSLFIDAYFMYHLPESSYRPPPPSNGRRVYRPFRFVTHVAADDKAQNSPRCRKLTEWAINDFNKTNNANLELVKILNVNKKIIVGLVRYLRFVAKDLNTGDTAIYRAVLHTFLTPMKLVYFKPEEAREVAE